MKYNYRWGIQLIPKRYGMAVDERDLRTAASWEPIGALHRHARQTS